MGVSRLGMQELAVNAADSEPCKRRRNTTDCCQDEREECICVSGTTLVQSPHSHNALLPQCLFCRYVLMCIPKHHLNLLLRWGFSFLMLQVSFRLITRTFGGILNHTAPHFWSSAVPILRNLVLQSKALGSCPNWRNTTHVTKSIQQNQGMLLWLRQSWPQGKAVSAVQDQDLLISHSHCQIWGCVMLAMLPWLPTFTSEQSVENLSFNLCSSPSLPQLRQGVTWCKHLCNVPKYRGKLMPRLGGET